MTFLPRLRLWFNINVVCLLSTERDVLPNMTVISSENLYCYTACLGILYIQHSRIYFWCFCYGVGLIMCYVLSFVVQIIIKLPFNTNIVMRIVWKSIVKISVKSSRLHVSYVSASLFDISGGVCRWLDMFVVVLRFAFCEDYCFICLCISLWWIFLREFVLYFCNVVLSFLRLFFTLS